MPGRKKDPNAPKRPLSAYFLYSNSVRQEIRDEMPGVPVSEIAKEIGKRWGELDEDDKQPFVEQAKEAKVKYEKELEEYNANKPDDDDEDEDEDDDEPKRKRKKSKKDPNAPKRPLTAYFLFANEVRSEIKDENPDFKVTDIAKEIGKRWAELDEDEKQPYKDKHTEAKVKYEKELEEYNASKCDDDDEEDEPPKKRRK